MDENTLGQIAGELLQALDRIQPISPLTDKHRSITIEDAYRIQFSLLSKKLKRGEKLIGWKVGATNQAVMEQLSCYEPLLGHLTTASIYSPEKPVIPFGGLIKPGIEPEIAFRMKRELEGPHVTPEMVLESVDMVFPAVEIVDCRINDWKIKVQDIIADNVMHRGIIVGEGGVSAKGMNWADEQVHVEINGRLIAIGTGKEVLGNPVNVVVWLVNKLGTFHCSLKKGDVIITGSMTRFLMVNKGDFVRFSFSRLGSMEFSFT